MLMEQPSEGAATTENRNGHSDQKQHLVRKILSFPLEWLTFWRRNYFFLILALPVYKMWIIEEPNKLELWNKLHFEEENTESLYHV